MVEYIGRYQISKTLGQGGMGTVYKAIDPNLERIVAIKCLNDDLSESEMVIARFLREARNVAALSHPNCVRLYLADEHEGKPYLVMEYIDGETLAERLEKNGALGLEEADRIVADCARALAAADERNIVHRDVKPGNIMIDRDGRALLTDFGIAQVQYEMAEHGETTVAGTPGYIAPELISEGKSDRRGDIFALGAVYYEMLTGERLVEGHDLQTCNAAFSRSNFPDLGPVIEAFGESIGARLQKMLDPEPNHRYPDYQSLLDDLVPAQAATRARAREAAPTSLMQRTAAHADQSRTVSMETTEARPPLTHTIPLDGRTSRRRVGLIATVTAGVAVMSIAIALTTGTDNPATSPESGSVNDWAMAVEHSAPVDEPASPDTNTNQNNQAVAGEMPVGRSETTLAGAEIEAAGSLSASGPTSAVPNRPRSSATMLLRELRGERGPEADTRLAMNSSAENADAAPAEVSTRSADWATTPETGTSTRSSARTNARSDLSGISVVGIGDSNIAEPMATAIKQRLQSEGLRLVESGFIAGFNQYAGPQGLDLAGVAGPATDSGVRYIVMARAVPSGTRELSYYGRHDVAYTAQIDVITYDLLETSQVVAGSTRQIEYTSLNASQQARSAATPWLDRIASQFKP